MNPWVLVAIAWIGQVILLWAKRKRVPIGTIIGAILDFGAVGWLCAQHRWILAVLTFAVLPLLGAAILGMATGLRNNRVKLSKASERI